MIEAESADAGQDASLDAIVAASVHSLFDMTPAQTHRDQAARLYADQSGLALKTVHRILDRRTKSPVQPLATAAIAEQQRVADTFFDLGLIPSRLRVADRVWKPT